MHMHVSCQWITLDMNAMGDRNQGIGSSSSSPLLCLSSRCHSDQFQGLSADGTALGCDQATMKLRPEQKQALVPVAAEYLHVTHMVTTERRKMAAALSKVGDQASIIKSAEA